MKSILISLGWLTITTSIFISADANAARSADVTYFYYSDAAHHDLVGMSEFFCGAGSTSTGLVTQYKTQVIQSCGDAANHGVPGGPDQSGGVLFNCHLYYDPYERYVCDF